MLGFQSHVLVLSCTVNGHTWQNLQDFLSVVMCIGHELVMKTHKFPKNQEF